MTNSLTEDLGHYVRRIMRLKGLKLRDIEIRSKGKITDGYVSGIISGAAKNPSVEKVVALAAGLGVGPDELFHVACGLPAGIAGIPHPADTSYAHHALELMQKILISPELMNIVQEAVDLSHEEREMALRAIKRLSSRRARARRGRGAV
ncbi:MAG TPA: helix-turn-helix transcriptional regulator [Blastocatellia bacterium]|nr:helix-turn-helix transcriptional regulator [Blastocatellia bacterium]